MQEKTPTSSLSQSILTRLQAPLTPGEQLWLLSLPMSLKLSAEEEKLLVRLNLEELAAAAPELKQRCEPYIDFEEDPDLLGE